MVLKCHSSYVHYNMFHNRSNSCCGGGNYNSIFMHNNCGGGFWGGFGLGMGLGFGNFFGGMFSGLCGGFMNMFGGWSMPMFPGFGGFSNLFGGCNCGCSTSSKSGRDYSEYASSLIESNTKVVKEEVIKTDGDLATFNDLDAKANVLLAKPMSVENNAKIDELLALIDQYNPNDGVNDTENITSKNQLIARLNAHKYTAPPSNDIIIGGKKVEEMTHQDIANITVEIYNQLTEDQKQALISKIGTIDIDLLVDLTTNTTIPPELRTLIKSRFYGTNVNVGKVDIVGKKVEYARDLVGLVADKVRDVTLNTGEECNVQSNGDIVVIKDSKVNNATNSVKYTYQEVIDGESIYKSDNGQLYTLQKDSNGIYALVQYHWHQGTGVKDVSSIRS